MTAATACRLSTFRCHVPHRRYPRCVRPVVLRRSGALENHLGIAEDLTGRFARRHAGCRTDRLPDRHARIRRPPYRDLDRAGDTVAADRAGRPAAVSDAVASGADGRDAMAVYAERHHIRPGAYRAAGAGRLYAVGGTGRRSAAGGNGCRAWRFAVARDADGLA